LKAGAKRSTAAAALIAWATESAVGFGWPYRPVKLIPSIKAPKTGRKLTQGTPGTHIVVVAVATGSAKVLCSNNTLNPHSTAITAMSTFGISCSTNDLTNMSLNIGRTLEVWCFAFTKLSLTGRNHLREICHSCCRLLWQLRNRVSYSQNRLKRGCKAILRTNWDGRDIRLNI
jgi:hypothetical protein